MRQPSLVRTIQADFTYVARTAAFAVGLFASLLSLFAADASARGPLPEHWVAPDSDWVVHVDAERLGQAPSLRPIFDALAASALGAGLADMGIDARMDVTSITLFGTISRGPDTRRETTTMLVGGGSLQDAIQRHIARHNGHALVLRSALQAEGRGILAWTIDTMSVHVALVPMHAKGHVGEPKFAAVLSDNSDQLQTCIGLLLHEKNGREAPPEADPAPVRPAPKRLGPLEVPEGSVFYACARDLDDAQPALSSGFLASADSLVAHFGYRDRAGATVVFGGLTVRGDESEDGLGMSQALHKIVEFWAARTAQLAETRPAMLEMLALVRACRISHDGPTVQIEMERTIHEPGSAPAIETVGPPRSGSTLTNPDIKDR